MNLFISKCHHISTGLLAGSTVTGIQHPNYKEYIDIRQMRRMSELVKMGIYAAQKVLGGVEQFDGPMITGTGLGCIQDTFLFMKNMVERDEQMLSPTHFIQSTHNTLAGTAGIMLSDLNYNITWTQRFHTFFFCLEDALLQLRRGSSGQTLLVLADEITPEISDIIGRMDCLPEDACWTGGSAAFIVNNSRMVPDDWQVKELKLIPAEKFTSDSVASNSPVYYSNVERGLYQSSWCDLAARTGINFIMDAIALSYCMQKEEQEFLLIGGDGKFVTLYHLHR